MKAVSPHRGRNGFSGAITGLTFSDVIQLKCFNQFYGSVTVEFDDKIGKIYFRDGEIIHAEHDSLTGKDAFYQIFLWPGGHFHTYPNVSCTSATIDCSWKMLLMEAHQLKDEGRLHIIPGTVTSRSSRINDKSNNAEQDLVSEINSLEAVVRAVLHTSDGIVHGESQFSSETTAAYSSYLINHADCLGEVFGVGPMLSASLEGDHGHFLIFKSSKNYLTLAVDPKYPAGETELSVRAIVASRKQVKAC